MYQSLRSSRLSHRKRKRLNKTCIGKPNKKKKVQLWIPIEIKALIASYIPYASLIEGMFDISRMSKYSYEYFGSDPIVMFQGNDVYGPVPMELFEQTVWKYRINTPNSNLGTILYGIDLLSGKYRRKIKKEFRNEVLIKLFDFFSLNIHQQCKSAFISLITNEEPIIDNLKTIGWHWESDWKGKIKEVLDNYEGEQMVINGTGIVAAKMIMGIRDNDYFDDEIRQSADKMYEEYLKDPWFQKCSDIM